LSTLAIFHFCLVATQFPCTAHFFINIVLCLPNCKLLHIFALIDCCCTGSHISNHFSVLPCCSKSILIPILAIDNWPIASGLDTQDIGTDPLVNRHLEQLVLAVVSVDFLVILGLDWLH
jgi:hypothetical protein